YENVSVVPSSLDWIKEGVVKTQGSYGKGQFLWKLLGILYRAVTTIEGLTQITIGNKLVSLSEQELILDCDNEGENWVCLGGYMDDAFKFIQHNGGLVSNVD
ncbi:hypothetical protein IFM89_003764, partial [Coptis chinensis]